MNTLPDDPDMDQEFHKGDIVRLLTDGTHTLYRMLRIGTSSTDFDYEVESPTGEKRFVGIDDIEEETEGNPVEAFAHARVQAIAHAATNYVQTKAIRYQQYCSYREMPRIDLETYARKEGITFDAVTGTIELIHAILNKTMPLSPIKEACTKLGIEYSKL